MHDATPPRARATDALIALVGAATLAALGFFAVFTTRLEFDDEGYMMFTVRRMLEGARPYEDLFTQYGPFYLWSRAALHGLTRLPVTHDVNRLGALVEWLLGAALAGALARHFTRSTPWAIVTGALSFLLFEVVTKEPGHPQQTVMNLTLLALALVGVTGPRARPAAVACGVCVGAVTMTKVNAGVYLAIPVAVALLRARPEALARRATQALALACAALPWVIARNKLAQPATIAFAVATSAGIAAAFATIDRRETTAARSPWGWSVAGALATCAALLAATFARGTTPAALIEGTLRGPARFAANNYVGFDQYPLAAAPVALAALAMSVAVWRGRLDARALDLARLGAGAATLGALAIGALTAGAGALANGGDLPCHAPWLLAVATPAAFLVAAPRAKDAPVSPARAALAVAAALNPLIAFPIFGSQAAYAVAPAVVAACVCAADGARAIGSPSARRGVGLVGALALAAVLAWRLDAAHRRFREGEALALPGASLVHLPAPTVALLRGVSSTLRARCDTVVTAPGFGSFHFWSEVPPPTGLFATDWAALLPPAAQQDMADALARSARPCALIVPGVALSRRASFARTPVVRLLTSQFRPALRMGPYLLVVRDDRPGGVSDSPRGARGGSPPPR